MHLEASIVQNQDKCFKGKQAAVLKRTQDQAFPKISLLCPYNQ
jgi:hypothetical protein